jgi:hypothetical protein
MSRFSQLVVAALATLGASFAAAFNSGSTGADGVLNPSGPVEIQLPESGVLNYVSINIPTGVTVTFRRNALNTPVTLLVAGDALIAGTLSVNGKPAAPSFGAGDGNVADDGLPGEGGPGGYSGGAGGKADPSTALGSPRTAQAGIGPGAGRPNVTGLTDLTCSGAGGSFGAAGTANCGSVGSTYGTIDLLPLIGGSGGSGGGGGTTTGGSGGGGGGGALLLAVTGRLTISGAIRADGGIGGDVGHPWGGTSGNAGGGGSGGAIRLVATILEGNGALSVAGVRGGNWTNVSSQTVGGAGRLRIESETCTRTGCPSNLPGPIFVAGLPALRIASVAGVAAPAAPTGSADIVLPSATPNPVEVVIASSNVPLGNTVSVTLTPPRGTPVVSVSTALQGTEASATAIASVSLIDGPSVLLATLSFSVAASQQAGFAQYTNGEKVLRVELAAAMNGTSQTTLITESGRRVVL